MDILNRSRRRAVRLVAACLLCMTMLPVQPLAGAARDAFDSQTITVDPTGEARNGEGYSAVLYDITNGLPTSDANAIAMTSDGCIWIGSYSGLLRYDGNRFERLDSTTGIASVVSLFVDSKDRLWIGTNDNGAAVLEKGEFRYFKVSDGLGSASVRSIAEDPAGNIYIATTEGVSCVDGNMAVHPIEDAQIGGAYIRSLRQGCDGAVYGVTMDGTVFTLRNSQVTGCYAPEQLGITDARAICPDPDREGCLYIGTIGSKLYYGKLDGGFTVEKEIDTGRLECINAINCVDGSPWICTDKGIGYYMRDEFTPISNVPMTTSVEWMCVDYQGNLWFTSSQQGVMKIVSNHFTDIFEKYHLEDEVVYSTCVAQSMLLVGTKNDGLIAVRNGKRMGNITVTSAVSASGKRYDDKDLLTILEDSKIRSIIRDSRERIWISTFGEAGLVRYDYGKVMRFGPEDGLPSDRVRTILERPDGSFLVACTGGVAVIEDDKVTKVYTEADGIDNSEVLTVSEGTDGEILVGTDGGGIFVIGDDGVTHYGTEEGLSSEVVMRIKKDATRDLYWIVTSNSIAYMDAEHQIHTVKDFPYPNNFDLYQNSRDEMWILSSSGIYVVPTEELIRNEEIEPRFYGRENGLTRIATANSYSELTEEEELYIAGTSGVARVNINEPFEDVTGIRMDVPFVDVDGVRYYPDMDGDFKVPASTERLTIHGYIYHYSLTEPQVVYSLDGFDRTASVTGRSDFGPVIYTNLPGGSYRFTMKLTNEEGRSSQLFSVKIVKQKALFEQIWFQVCCLLLGAALIAFLVIMLIRIRTKKYLKKQEEDKMLIRMIVEAFAKVIDMKDEYTNGHSTRVADYTVMLARELGYDEETLEKWHNIALLHDIGKVSVPQGVLNKQGKLTDEEFALIKSHPVRGYETLKEISIMPELAVGAESHHERPDGKGYPKGLKGDEIPRVAQVIAVADCFDAMYSDRPYRKRMNFDKAVSIIKEVSGTQLTSDVVDAFLRLVDKGEFRLPEDHGGGSMEDIDNIHKKQNAEEAEKKAEAASTEPEKKPETSEKSEK
ncbi:MAG: HD domain-containing protein [Oscillospiraceae bacterium]|nr:HD domain-containing protein [Oscillospiraceae bacterium]